jgi:hypothetical protein
MLQPHVRRLFSSKPPWQREADMQAEIDASKHLKNSAKGTLNDQTMAALTHELNAEKISNVNKLESKLKQLIAKCNELKAGAHDARGRALYGAIRKRCLESREELIVQRETSGLSKLDATGVVHQMYPIPGVM